MKRHFAVLVLLGSIASGASLFAQQRFGGPSPTAAQAPALTPAQQEETLRQAQDLLQRMRSTPNMPESDRANMLRELERAMVQLQRAQENAPRLQIATPTGVRVQVLPVITAQPINPGNLIIAGDGLNGGQLIARRVTQIDGATAAWWTNTNLLTRLGLTDDQKLKIERAYESHRQNLVATKELLEKEEAQLAKLLEADPLDRTASLAQIYKAIQARGEMEKVTALMTFEMREVLTRAQWTQLQAQQPVVELSIRTQVTPGGTPGQRGPGGGGRGGRGQN